MSAELTGPFEADVEALATTLYELEQGSLKWRYLKPNSNHLHAGVVVEYMARARKMLEDGYDPQAADREPGAVVACSVENDRGSRTEFEQTFRHNNLHKGASGEYEDDSVQAMWHGWQAARPPSIKSISVVAWLDDSDIAWATYEEAEKFCRLHPRGVALATDYEAMRARAEADARRLDWLDTNEADLVFHREMENESGEYSIWCNVVKDGKSISGHPLAYARDAIDYAIAEQERGAK